MIVYGLNQDSRALLVLSWCDDMYIFVGAERRNEMEKEHQDCYCKGARGCGWRCAEFSRVQGSERKRSRKEGGWSRREGDVTINLRADRGCGQTQRRIVRWPSTCIYVWILVHICIGRYMYISDDGRHTNSTKVVLARSRFVCSRPKGKPRTAVHCLLQLTLDSATNSTCPACSLIPSEFGRSVLVSTIALACRVVKH